MTIAMDWYHQRVSINSRPMEPKDALYQIASTINHDAMPGSWLVMDKSKYIPIDQIEAYFPQLTCQGKLFKSWRQRK